MVKKYDKYYVSYREKQHSLYIFLGELGIVLIFYFYSRIKGVSLFHYLPEIFFIGLPFYLFYKLYIIIKAQRERNMRLPIYQEFVRSMIGAHREDIAFKKSLLR